MTTLSITCITTIDHENAARAVDKTSETLIAAGLPLNLTYWISDKPCPLPVMCPVMWTRVPVFEQHNWMLMYNVHSLVNCPVIVQTDYNIVVQSDGFAVNPDAWTDEFLEYDYIGAIWPWYNSRYRVGNGGFSLRSRKLYDALQEIKYERAFTYLDFKGHECYVEDQSRIPNIDNVLVAEDALICRFYRDVLENDFGIKFCPDELASRFSIEDDVNSIWMGKSFGFHSKSPIFKKYYSHGFPLTE